MVSVLDYITAEQDPKGHVAQAPISKSKKIKLLKPPPEIKDMSHPDWAIEVVPQILIPPDEMSILPETVMDPKMWAETAVDFYVSERGKGCYVDLVKFKDLYLHLERPWWGVLLGYIGNGYFDTGHIDAWVTRLMMLKKVSKKLVNADWTIMPATFVGTHLPELNDNGLALCDGRSSVYTAWWKVNRVLLPVNERTHWILIELNLPRFEMIVHDSFLKYTSETARESMCKRFSNQLFAYLTGIDYWTKAGKVTPKKLKFTVTVLDDAPQQADETRGDCGPFTCMAMERLARGNKFLPPKNSNMYAVGTWFRHYMARAIYARRFLPEQVLN